MSPERLVEWEAVLRSQYAVLLLLIAVVFGLLRWIAALQRENRELNQWIREHLQSEGDFRVVLDHVREAMTLGGKAEG